MHEGIQKVNKYYYHSSFDQLTQNIVNLVDVSEVKIILPDNWHFSNYALYNTVIDVYHENMCCEISQKPIEDKYTSTANYLKGNKITPTDIFLNEDGNFQTCVKRDLLLEIEKDLNSKLNLNMNSLKENCYIINYEPSSGATTLGHILLYRFRKVYPAILVKSMEQDAHLLEAIDHISKEKQKRVLILIDDDTVNITSKEVFRFAETLKNILLKSCIIFLQRKLSNESPVLKNEFLRKSFELKRKLHSPPEEHSFNELFKKFSKLNLRHNKLEYVHLFGLYAFSDDYKDTIDNILKNTLTKLNSSRELTNENKKSIKQVLYLVSLVKK